MIVFYIRKDFDFDNPTMICLPPADVQLHGEMSNCPKLANRNLHPMSILIIPDAETWARLTNQARGSLVHEYFRWAHHAFKYTCSTQWRNKTPLRLYQNPSHFPPIAKILRRSRTSASTGWLGGSLLTSRAGDATSPWTSWRWLWASSSPSLCLSLCQSSSAMSQVGSDPVPVGKWTDLTGLQMNAHPVLK